MSRSGYTDDDDDGRAFMWRGQVASAIRGRRGQKFLRDLSAALDEMPAKRLIANNLRQHGEVCTLGALGAKRGIELEVYDPEDSAHHEGIAKHFDIAYQLVAEVEYMNDEAGWGEESPEARWSRMRRWVERSLVPDITI